MGWAEVRAAAIIVRREYQLACRAPAFWAVAALGALVAVWRASTGGTTAALGAYQAWQMVTYGVGALAILLAGAAAARDRQRGATELVLAKSGGSSGGLVAARFVGTWLSMLSIAAIVFAASSLGQAVLGGTPWRLGPYAAGLVRTAAPIALATALGFSLASLLTTPLAAGVAAIYWIVVPLGRSYLPTALDLTLTQHWREAALLAAGLVALAACLHARAIRGERERRAIGGWLSVLLLAGAGLSVLRTVHRGEDGLVNADPVLWAMASQTAIDGRQAPGFWLRDGEGRLVDLDQHRGRPVVLAFWGPASRGSVRALSVLGELAREHGEEGPACIAVCLDRDAGAMEGFAREAGPEVTVAWDRGRHFGVGMEWADSPVAVSYDVPAVPTVFFLDGERRLVERWRGEERLDGVAWRVARLLEGR